MANWPVVTLGCVPEKMLTTGCWLVFFVMVVLQNFMGSGNYSIVGPYMGELWPARLRGSGMGLVYGVGNLGKFIGPAGLALIAGGSVKNLGVRLNTPMILAVMAIGGGRKHGMARDIPGGQSERQGRGDGSPPVLDG